jgi:hypothetical protein
MSETKRKPGRPRKHPVEPALDPLELGTPETHGVPVWTGVGGVAEFAPGKPVAETEADLEAKYKALLDRLDIIGRKHGHAPARVRAMREFVDVFVGLVCQ